MVTIGVLAFPAALFWMLFTNRFSIDSFAIGYAISFSLLWAFGIQKQQVSFRRLPKQLATLLLYLVLLLRDILISALDVARRVVDPRLPLATGIIAVEIQDESEVMAALSAHAITITPGELVVDFDDAHRMYVHCLDVYSSLPTLHTAQTRRLTVFRRILGDE